MVERRVNIDVNYEGVDEARASLEELDEAIRESSTDIRTLSSDVQNLANSLERLNQNASAVRTHMETVSDSVYSRDRYTKPTPEPTTRSGTRAGHFEGGVWYEAAPPGKQFPDNVKISNLNRGIYKASATSLESPSNIIKYDADKNGLAMARGAIERILEKDFNVIIAKAGKEVVGALSYTIEDLGNYIQMDIREVGAKYIGHGVGPRMVAQAVAKAKEKNVDLIKMSHALPNAHNSYIGSGFEMPDIQDKGIYPTNMYMRLGKNIELASLEADPDERYYQLQELLNKSLKTKREQALWYNQETGQDITPSYRGTRGGLKYEGLEKYEGLLLERYHVHGEGRSITPSTTDLKLHEVTRGMSSIVSSDKRILEMVFTETTNMKALIREWGRTFKTLRGEGAPEDVITKAFIEMANKHGLETSLYKMPQLAALSPFGYVNKPYIQPEEGREQTISPYVGMLGAYNPKTDVQQSQSDYLRLSSPMIGLQDDVQFAKFTSALQRKLGPLFGVKMTKPAFDKDFGKYSRLVVVAEQYLDNLADLKNYVNEAWDAALEEIEMRVNLTEDYGLTNINLYQKTPMSMEKREMHDALGRIEYTSANAKISGLYQKELDDRYNNLLVGISPAIIFADLQKKLQESFAEDTAADENVEIKNTLARANWTSMSAKLDVAYKKEFDSYLKDIANGMKQWENTVEEKYDDLLMKLSPAIVFAGLQKKLEGTYEQDLAVDERKEMAASAKTLRTRRQVTRADAMIASQESKENILLAGSIPSDQAAQEDFWKKYMSEYGATREAPPGTGRGALKSPLSKGGIFEQVVAMSKNMGTTIDALANKGGILGKLSWTFTSLAMSALGVYFSLMSVVNMLSQGIMAVFNPLQNLQGAIQGYAIGQMKLKNGVADLDKYFESLGIGIGDVAEGSLRFQSILGGFQTSLAAFGAKLMLDPDVWENLQGILAEVQDFLTREETFTLVKGIIAALRDSLPDILEAFMFIGEVVRTMLPYAGLFAKAWAAALVIMPVASFASALLNIGKAVTTLIGLFGALKTAIATSTAVSQLGVLGSLGAVGAGAAAGMGGIGILHNIGALSYVRETGYNIVHDETTNPYQHQPIPWWDVMGGITGTPTFRAGGGPLRAGQMAVVGEKGPEIIIPKGDVDVVPNHKVRFLADGTGMQSYQMHEANRLVESNTDAIEGSTRATQELVDIFKRYQVEGTSAVRATGNSPAGGPTSETLGNAGPFTMSGGGKAWNMDTRVGLGEGIYKTSGSDVFSGDGLTVPTVPEAEGGGLLDMNTALIMGTVFGPGALKKLGGLKGIKGGLKGLGGKLGGLLGRGAKVGAPAMLEIDEMLGMGARGAETFEILGKPATMTARTGMGGMGALGTVAKLAGPVGAALGMMEMLRIGAPAAGFSNEQLTAGNTKEFNDYLAAFHKDSKEGTEDTNMLLSSINSTLQNTDKTLTGAFSTNGAGTEAGNGGGPGTGTSGGQTGLEGTPNPVPTLADGYSYIGNHFMNGPKKENPWATGLTGNPIIDFAPGGEGWNRDYGAGDMYGPGGSAGAPSVKYNYDPYYPTQPGSNRDEWSQVNDTGARSGTGWSFTTPFKDTETYDFNKIQTVTDKNKGMLTMGGESTLIEKAGFDFAALEKAMKLSESTKAHEEWGANLDRSDFGYMNAEELRGAAEGAVGEIVTQGKDVFIRQADGSLKQIASAAAGGLLKAGGLINAHAGEVIGPLGQVASTIASAANITSNNSSASSQNISINITVNGNADQNVTDEMIRKIKKELFGRGVIA